MMKFRWFVYALALSAGGLVYMGCEQDSGAKRDPELEAAQQSSSPTTQTRTVTKTKKVTSPIVITLGNDTWAADDCIPCDPINFPDDGTFYSFFVPATITSGGAAQALENVADPSPADCNNNNRFFDGGSISANDKGQVIVSGTGEAAYDGTSTDVLLDANNNVLAFELNGRIYTPTQGNGVDCDPTP